MKRSAKRDVAQDITNLIIRKIEEGTLPWRRPWKKTGAGGAPLRANGVPYTGINRLYLWAAADAMGYESRYWMTYRQCSSADRSVGGKLPNQAFTSIRRRKRRSIGLQERNLRERSDSCAPTPSSTRRRSTICRPISIPTRSRRHLRHHRRKRRRSTQSSHPFRPRSAMGDRRSIPQAATSSRCLTGTTSSMRMASSRQSPMKRATGRAIPAGLPAPSENDRRQRLRLRRATRTDFGPHCYELLPADLAKAMPAISTVGSTS